MPDMKRAIKDSVFTYLFKQPEYTRQLYLSLHPEDTSVTEADCKIVTLENVISTGIYNDLGIQVRDKLLLLIEAQSTFSINLALRLLLYLAASYKEYVEDHKLDLYGSKPITLPRPEMYVIYTGDKKYVPDTLYLSDLYDGQGSVELKVKVLRDGQEGDILSQYVRFCKIADNKRKQYKSAEAIRETLRQCKEEDVLMPFLATREKEVMDIMTFLFDNETIQRIHDYNVALEAEHQGMRRGQEKGISAMVSTLQGLSIDRATVIQSLIREFDLLPQTAEEKVSQYWVQ